MGFEPHDLQGFRPGALAARRPTGSPRLTTHRVEGWSVLASARYRRASELRHQDPRGGSRTHNLHLRRVAPSPLGHARKNTDRVDKEPNRGPPGEGRRGVQPARHPHPTLCSIAADDPTVQDKIGFSRRTPLYPQVPTNRPARRRRESNPPSRISTPARAQRLPRHHLDSWVRVGLTGGEGGSARSGGARCRRAPDGDDHRARDR